VLYRPLLLAGTLALLGTTAGCTGLTKPDSITISAEPAAEAPAAKAGQGAAQRPAPPPAQAAPAPAAPGCGE
jgi:hypothetical protein